MDTRIEAARERLKSAREAAGLSLSAASELAQVEEHVWRYFEWNGRRIPPEFAVMCRAVRLDPVAVLREAGLL